MNKNRSVRSWPKFFYFCFYLVKIFSSLNATEFLPWVGPTLEFEWRNHFRYQQSKLKNHLFHDLFLNVSLSNAYQDLGLELEMTAANTFYQRGKLDQLKMTGRYVILDDLLQDFVSLTAGLSLTQAFHHSLYDKSSFHHGYHEGEIFLASGKEWSFSQNWHSRLWGVVGLATAINRSFPWLHVESTYERRWKDKHEGRIGIKTLYGFGHQKLKDPFKGYGFIAHRSVDLFLRYTYLIDFFGQTSVELSQRLYSKNFASSAFSLTFQLLYTFGLKPEW